MDLLSRLREFKAAPRRMLTTKNGILGSIVGGVALLLAVAVASAPEPDKKVVEETAWPVTTMAAVPGSVSPELRLYGRVETPRQSSLTASVVAYVESVEVLEGASVAAGDLLVQLDPTDAALALQGREADLTEARANLESLKLKIAENKAILVHEKSLYELTLAKVQRHRQLRKQQTISEETLNAVLSESDRQAISLSRQQGLVDDAVNQLTRAQSQVSRAEAIFLESKANLARTGIRAPFDGRITAVRVSPGELVQPGTPIVEMYDITNMEVRAQIPTSHLAAIRESLANGQALLARLDDNGHKIEARLTRLSGEVSPGRSSIDGLFTVNPQAALEIGRAVGVTLTLPPVEGAILVPVQSLYGHDRVFLVENERLRAITVERLGEITDDSGHLNVLVRSDEIEPGAAIVTSQLSMAVTGLKVMPGKPQNELAAAWMAGGP